MRVRPLLALIATSSATLLHAQNVERGNIQLAPANPQNSQRQVGNGTVTGHIFCADTNAPARFARVNLQRLPDPSSTNTGRAFIGGGNGTQGTTDLDGLFTIPNVSPGTYAFRVSYDGYVDPSAGMSVGQWMNTDPAVQSQVRQQMQTVTITGSETATADIRLEHGASISGKITYDDGSPATGLTVQVRQGAAIPGQPNQNRFIGFVGPTRTDDHGDFRITGLPEGQFEVMTNLVMPHISNMRGPNGALRPYGNTHQVFSPGVFREKQAEVIKLTRGEDRTGVMIVIPTHGFHTISGTVIRKSGGQPVYGGNIQLLDGEDNTVITNTQIQQDGGFSLDMVPAGSYIVRVGAAFDQPPPEANPGRPGFHFFGTDQIGVQVSQSDVTGLTLQVPDAADPTRPPRPLQPGGVVIR